VPLTIPDRVVVFDYGEVISHSPGNHDREQLLQVAGLTADELFPAYDRYRHDLDRGSLSIVEYWNRIGSDLGVEWSLAQIQELWAIDFRSWISIDLGSAEIIRDLADGGTRIAILSNAGYDFGSPLRFSPIGRLFERVFISAEMDALKPDPAIYLTVAEDLGITPAEMVFIDNKRENTDGAATLGITVHHFTGAPGLRDFLTALAN
jgi:putative hydrolase of the HAD superfamily